MNDNNLRRTFIAIICLLPFLASCDSGKIIAKIFPPEKCLHYTGIPSLTDRIPPCLCSLIPNELLGRATTISWTVIFSVSAIGTIKTA